MTVNGITKGNCFFQFAYIFVKKEKSNEITFICVMSRYCNKLQAISKRKKRKKESKEKTETHLFNQIKETIVVTTYKEVKETALIGRVG